MSNDMVFRLKQLILALAYRLDQWVPRALGIWLRNRATPWRPVLDAVELHVVDQCNMNCTGCSHFSPFARPWMADPATVLADLAALRAKFRGGIRHINLLGGEPLLHPGLSDLMVRIRALAPESCITVVTNGLLLRQPALAEAFLAACRQVRARIKWTLYPPLAAQRAAIEARLRAAGVVYRIETGDTFWARMVPDGSAPARRAFRFCRRTTYCPYLREGRLYPCAQAFHIRDYARVQPLGGALPAFGLDRDPTRLGLDFRVPEVTAHDILLFLMSPGPVCRYCSDSVRHMAWSHASRDPSDWRR